MGHDHRARHEQRRSAHHGHAGTPRTTGRPADSGDVIGFCLAWNGQRHGELYLSGDTVLFRGIHRVAERHRVSVAVLNMGAARFAASGPIRYTFDAAEAARVARLLQARVVIPSHYECFTHFREPLAEAQRVLAEAGVPARWVPAGSTAELEV